MIIMKNISYLFSMVACALAMDEYFVDWSAEFHAEVFDLRHCNYNSIFRVPFGGPHLLALAHLLARSVANSIVPQRKAQLA